MNRRLIPIVFATLILFAGYARAATPNFVIIFADDQGYGDLTCFGSETIKTPNVDRLAKEGRKFTSFMVASPVCTPSRAALLTGCYPKRVGMHQHVLFPQSTKGLNPSEHTIADHLKSQGYATACFWQMAPWAPSACSANVEWFRYVSWNSIFQRYEPIPTTRASRKVELMGWTYFGTTQNQR